MCPGRDGETKALVGRSDGHQRGVLWLRSADELGSLVQYDPQGPDVWGPPRFARRTTLLHQEIEDMDESPAKAAPIDNHV